MHDLGTAKALLEIKLKSKIPKNFFINTPPIKGSKEFKDSRQIAKKFPGLSPMMDFSPGILFKVLFLL